MYTSLNERQVETQIDQRLRNLQWIVDPTNPSCNVTHQTARTLGEQKALQGKKPDYVLYDGHGHNAKPLAIIEVKKPGRDLQKAKAPPSYSPPPAAIPPLGTSSTSAP